MISYANKKCNAYGVRNLILDTDADVTNLPKSTAGSTAYVIESGDRYICNSKGQWIKVKSSSEPEDEEDEYVHIIYDGGDVLGWPKS